jgi:hypothetical protein
VEITEKGDDTPINREDALLRIVVTYLKRKVVIKKEVTYLYTREADLNRRTI